MIYYYRLVNGTSNIIEQLGAKKKLPNGCVRITKDEYDNYKNILLSIPSKAGYTKKVTLYVDGTYEVEYLPIVEVEEDEE